MYIYSLRSKFPNQGVLLKYGVETGKKLYIKPNLYIFKDHQWYKYESLCNGQNVWIPDKVFLNYKEVVKPLIW